MALETVNRKLARLNEVKARAAVRTRNRLAEQDEAAQVRLEAARQAEMAKIAEETNKAEAKRHAEAQAQLVTDSEKPLVEASKLASNVNPEVQVESLSGGASKLKKGSK